MTMMLTQLSDAELDTVASILDDEIMCPRETKEGPVCCGTREELHSSIETCDGEETRETLHSFIGTCDGEQRKEELHSSIEMCDGEETRETLHRFIEMCDVGDYIYLCYNVEEREKEGLAYKLRRLLKPDRFRWEWTHEENGFIVESDVVYATEEECRMKGMQLTRLPTAIERSIYGEFKLSIKAYIGDDYEEELLGRVQESGILVERHHLDSKRYETCAKAARRQP